MKKLITYKTRVGASGEIRNGKLIFRTSGVVMGLMIQPCQINPPVRQDGPTISGVVVTRRRQGGTFASAPKFVIPESEIPKVISVLQQFTDESNTAQSVKLPKVRRKPGRSS